MGAAMNQRPQMEDTCTYPETWGRELKERLPSVTAENKNPMVK